jgi:hypothetical protein
MCVFFFCFLLSTNSTISDSHSSAKTINWLGLFTATIKSLSPNQPSLGPIFAIKYYYDGVQVSSGEYLLSRHCQTQTAVAPAPFIKAPPNPRPAPCIERTHLAIRLGLAIAHIGKLIPVPCSCAYPDLISPMPLHQLRCPKAALAAKIE